MSHLSQYLCQQLHLDEYISPFMAHPPPLMGNNSITHLPPSNPPPKVPPYTRPRALTRAMHYMSHWVSPPTPLLEHQCLYPILQLPAYFCSQLLYRTTHLIPPTHWHDVFERSRGSQEIITSLFSLSSTLHAKPCMSTRVDVHPMEILNSFAHNKLDLRRERFMALSSKASVVPSMVMIFFSTLSS